MWKQLTEEWLEEWKQTPGQQDDSDIGGNNEWGDKDMPERHVNQVAGLKKALDARDANAQLDRHGIRFAKDPSYILSLSEDEGRKVIGRLQTLGDLEVDDYETIVGQLGGSVEKKWPSADDIVNTAIKKFEQKQQGKEVQAVLSNAKSNIHEPEYASRFDQDYKDIVWNRQVTPDQAQKISDTILNSYRYELAGKSKAQNGVLSLGASSGGVPVGTPQSADSGRKHYEDLKASWWSDQDLAKYYPQYHSNKK